jgi:hypothetical protein
MSGDGGAGGGKETVDTEGEGGELLLDAGGEGGELLLGSSSESELIVVTEGKFSLNMTSQAVKKVPVSLS